MRPHFDLAEDLWVRGAGHLLGAQALQDFSERYALETGVEDVETFVFNGKFSASLHLLLGYAAELLLKSAYILNGGKPTQLKQRDLGHDLVATLEAAERQGFQSTAPNLRWVVENIRDPHLEHRFRYGGAEYMHMPALPVTFAALEALATELRPASATGSDWRG